MNCFILCIQFLIITPRITPITVKINKLINFLTKSEDLSASMFIRPRKLPAYVHKVNPLHLHMSVLHLTKICNIAQGIATQLGCVTSKGTLETHRIAVMIGTAQDSYDLTNLGHPLELHNLRFPSNVNTISGEQLLQYKIWVSDLFMSVWRCTKLIPVCRNKQ